MTTLLNETPQTRLTFCLLCLLQLTPVSALPTIACSGMTPIHGAQQPGHPYYLDVTPSYYTPGRELLVRIFGPSGFTGLMMQARVPGEDAPVGVFRVLSSHVKTINCTQHYDTVTHTSNIIKRSVDIRWKAPQGSSLPVHFIATIVKDKDHWWKVKSQIITDQLKTSTQMTSLALSTSPSGLMTAISPSDNRFPDIADYIKLFMVPDSIEANLEVSNGQPVYRGNYQHLITSVVLFMITNSLT